MPSNPREMNDRITRTQSAWETLRPQKTFAGMSLDQFREKLAPSLAARATIARLENELIAAQNQRDDADATSLEAIQLVVNAVKGDPDEGEDGELYEAMGYVRKSERRSGLSRKAKTTETTPKA
jgi:hypothetical protein